jgi:hypothetical protein
MTALKQAWLAIAASVVLVGAASAQNSAPSQAVYVTAQDGNPKVYYVTGAVPPDKLPAVAPAVPAAPAPILPAMPKSVRQDAPAQLPAVPAAPAEVSSRVDATCATGHCGPRSKHGPLSCWGCLWTPATIPPPLGTSVRGAFDMQRDNALAEYFVIYREDFHAADAVLNRTGIRHLDGVIRRFGTIASSVKVEPTGNAALDQKRIETVVGMLVQAGIPAQEAATRVVLGGTRAEGLRNGDIEAIYRSGGIGGSGLGMNSMGGGFGGGSGAFGGYGGIGGIGGFGFR